MGVKLTNIENCFHVPVQYPLCTVQTTVRYDLDFIQTLGLKWGNPSWEQLYFDERYRYKGFPYHLFVIDAIIRFITSIKSIACLYTL